VSNRRTSPISAAKGHRDDEGRAAHRLVGLHHRRHRPGRHDHRKLLLRPAQPLIGVGYCVDRFLKDDLLSGMLEALRGQPSSMR
jgi:hypothetical protein